MRLYLGDCVEVMAGLTCPDTSYCLEECDGRCRGVDAIITDPPYGLEFMGKEWDRLWAKRDKAQASEASRPFLAAAVNQYVAGDQAQAWHTRWCREAYRLLKPGGHLVAFGGTRTFHRLACAMEAAGFEIRDCLMWLYGSGFPKSHDVSKAIDKAAGAERPVVGPSGRHGGGANQVYARDKWTAEHQATMGAVSTGPATDAASQWAGWGTALKPAWEPILLARKPLEGTVAENVQHHGTGALNVQGCRIGDEERFNPSCGHKDLENRFTVTPISKHRETDGRNTVGRWPANVVLDEEAAGLVDEQTGDRPSASSRSRPPVKAPTSYAVSDDLGLRECRFAGETGGASRFFYTGKATRADRDGSRHPTVKPTDLCKWLVRLITPPGGTVLDPFCGSGPIVLAARDLGFDVIGIDREAPYLDDTWRRLRQGSLL